MGTLVRSAASSAYEQAFARAPIGMALIGLDSRFLDVNETLCRIGGRSREELIGLPFHAITHPDDREEDLALAAEIVRGERDVFKREKRYLGPDGSTRWVAVSGSLIRAEDGAPLHFVFHLQDITERRATLEELRQSEARFRSAFDDALTGMALTGPDGRLRRINRTAAEILGRDAERLVGVPVAEFTHPDDSEGDRRHMASIIAGEADGGRWEKRYVRPSGEIVWAEVSTVLVRNADGTPRHFVTQMADISERKRAERVKDEFLATISHELRTPLTSIQGYVDLLGEADGDLSPAMHRHAVEAIQRNAARLLRLVDDVQFIAQARAQTLAVRRSPVQLDRVVAECVEWIAPRAADRGLQLSVSTEEVAVADGDRERLVQAVDHLLTNALNYTESGGRVDVRLTRERGAAVIEVADTGIGIAPGDREQLFERFFRASSAVGQAVQGVGLGLSIVKAIVELHGGSISVTSEIGVGSTFTVRLPAAAA